MKSADVSGTWLPPGTPLGFSPCPGDLLLAYEWLVRGDPPLISPVPFDFFPTLLSQSIGSEGIWEVHAPRYQFIPRKKKKAGNLLWVIIGPSCVMSQPEFIFFDIFRLLSRVLYALVFINQIPTSIIFLRILLLHTHNLFHDSVLHFRGWGISLTQTGEVFGDDRPSPPFRPSLNPLSQAFAAMDWSSSSACLSCPLLVLELSVKDTEQSW